ncbi:membrane protein [Saccharothrix sp. NRRL B-16348]|uniref:MFS transporter n=1 Tax=Saccharothrix sp. NRRL B-16348 TaxID=1415542 RepID=UPI0006ADD930|nr:MFS transporter [Saccharothrix sp. NRRL B-16348]KOX19013.1 membrane protein [Saccharothrix sp. NRRL B-16348]
MSTVEVTSGSVRGAAVGVAVTFGLNGVAVASWFARVPAARDALGLGAGALGLLLLAMSAGATLAMLTAGEVTHRLGARRTVCVSTVGVSAGLVVAGAAIGVWPSAVAAGVGLFLLGYGSGTCNVAMNVEAAAVERMVGRTVMPRFHAVWSSGTVVAAGLAAVAAWVRLPVTAHLVGVAGVTLVGTLVAARSFRYATDNAVGGKSGVLTAWREPRTVLIGLLVLVLAFTEGTANDWVAVAFVDGYAFGPAAGAVVFGVFVTTMTFGRVVGTVALDRWGRAPVLVATMLLAIAGVALAVLGGEPAVAVAGVALWGLGTSLGFPVGMSAAADEPGRAAARVSVVAVIGYTAFLAGPPVVGLLGDQVGILRALLVVPLLLIPALALVPVLRPLPTASPTTPASPTPPATPSP